jgi:hypothetical protein
LAQVVSDVPWCRGGRAISGENTARKPQGRNAVLGHGVAADFHAGVGAADGYHFEASSALKTDTIE